MREKGFTLIELLGVITILAILGILILPQIISQLKKQEPEIDETTKKLVIAATENFVERNPSDYPMNMGNRFCITLAQLVSDGIMEAPIKTANGTEISLDTIVEVNVLKNDELDITYDSPNCQAIQPRLLYGIMRNQASNATPDYNNMAVTVNEEGIYKTTEKGENIYFYRGELSIPTREGLNNHLKLDNTCWLILRTTPTHGVKLVYNGTPTSSGECTSANQVIGTSVFENFDDTAEPNTFYIYLDATGEHDSTIKTAVDNWYRGNDLSTNDKEHLETTDFCIDRSYREELSPSFSREIYDRYYGAYDRLSTGTRQPSLDCPNSGDIYRLKVGLLSADEVAFAGHYTNGTNQGLLLRAATTYWTLTPWDSTAFNVYGTTVRKANTSFVVESSGGLIYKNAKDEYGVRPVISLKPGIMVFGEGTYSNPYTIAK